MTPKPRPIPSIKIEPNITDAILETIHDSLLVLDKDLRVLVANPVFYNKFHVKKDETEGFQLSELGNGQWNIPLLLELLKGMFIQNVDFTNFKINHTFPHIGERSMLLNAKRVEQKVKGEQFILLAIADLTEYINLESENKELQKEAEELQQIKASLRNKNDELEKMNKELASFAYVASHDLQEPLRIIRSFTKLILQKEAQALTETGKDYFMRIEESIKRMQILIDDLLTYSRTNTTEKKFEKTDINKVLDEAKKELQNTIDEKKAVIDADKLCEMNLIRFQFRQLLQNILSNALKFSKPENPPHIIIKSENAKGSDLQNEKLVAEKEYCHFSISDDGIGFEQRFSERIFEMFQRLHGKSSYEGTGIGLAIVKKIVENHNGVITASGELEKGATFDIYLPLT